MEEKPTKYGNTVVVVSSILIVAVCSFMFIASVVFILALIVP